MQKSTDSLDESRVKKRDVSIESVHKDNSIENRKRHSTSMVSLHAKSPYLNNDSKSPVAKQKFKKLAAYSKPSSKNISAFIAVKPNRS